MFWYLAQSGLTGYKEKKGERTKTLVISTLQRGHFLGVLFCLCPGEDLVCCIYLLSPSLQRGEVGGCVVDRQGPLLEEKV